MVRFPRAEPLRHAPRSAKAAIAALQGRLDEARSCSRRAVETCALGVEQDVASVCAALVEPRGSGPAKGRIDKLGLLKRQRYGCAGFELAQRRIVPAA